MAFTFPDVEPPQQPEPSSFYASFPPGTIGDPPATLDGIQTSDLITDDQMFFATKKGKKRRKRGRDIQKQDKRKGRDKMGSRAESTYNLSSFLDSTFTHSQTQSQDSEDFSENDSVANSLAGTGVVSEDDDNVKAAQQINVPLTFDQDPTHEPTDENELEKIHNVVLTETDTFYLLQMEQMVLPLEKPDLPATIIVREKNQEYLQYKKNITADLQVERSMITTENQALVQTGIKAKLSVTSIIFHKIQQERKLEMEREKQQVGEEIDGQGKDGKDIGKKDYKDTSRKDLPGRNLSHDVSRTSLSGSQTTSKGGGEGRGMMNINEQLAQLYDPKQGSIDDQVSKIGTYVDVPKYDKSTQCSEAVIFDVYQEAEKSAAQDGISRGDRDETASFASHSSTRTGGTEISSEEGTKGKDSSKPKKEGDKPKEESKEGEKKKKRRETEDDENSLPMQTIRKLARIEQRLSMMEACVLHNVHDKEVKIYRGMEKIPFRKGYEHTPTIHNLWRWELPHIIGGGVGEKPAPIITSATSLAGADAAAAERASELGALGGLIDTSGLLGGFTGLGGLGGFDDGLSGNANAIQVSHKFSISSMSLNKYNKDMLAVSYIPNLNYTKGGLNSSSDLMKKNDATKGKSDKNDPSTSSLSQSASQIIKPSDITSGIVCFWSLKNLRYPLHHLETSSSPISIDFSQAHPSVLSTGSLDGSVALYDIRARIASGQQQKKDDL
ncbi:MAG: hypothetical protein EZS28_007279, partial [Streblomastix strix]